MTEAISFDYPRRRAVSKTGINGLPAYVPRKTPEPSYSFQQALQSILNQSPRRLQPQTPSETAELLSINPNMNLKLVSTLHPGAGLVTENGHTRLVIPIPQLDQPGLQAHSSAIRQAALLDDFDRQPLKLETQAVNEDGQDSAFGKVVASTALTAALMGHGIQRSCSVTPGHLTYLLKGAVPAKSIDSVHKKDQAQNDYSHWHLGAV